MAEITQKVQGVNPTSYIGLSKEPDRVRPNTGFGELFKGIGSLAEGAVTAIDEKNKEDITNSLYGGVDDIYKEMGVDAAAEAGAAKTPLFTGNENNQNVNPAVAETVERNTESLARLKTALEQGKISQMYYAQRSEALVRNLRAQYPGYREFIDDKVSKITGMKPANAIIREINNAIEARKSSAQQSAEKDIGFIRSNLEHLPKDKREEAIAGGWNDPAKRAEYMTLIGNRQGMISEIQVQKQKLELQAKAGNVLEENIVGYLQNYSYNMVGLQLDKAYRELDPLLKGLGEGQVIPPEQVMKIRAGIEALKIEAIKQFDTELASQYGDGDKTFLRTLPPAKIKELKDQIEKRFADVIETVEKGDFSLLKANKSFVTMQTDADVRKAFTNSPWMRGLNTIKEALGPEAIKWVLNAPDKYVKNIKEMDKAFSSIIRAQTLSGDKGQNLGTMLKGLRETAETAGIPLNKAKEIASATLTDAATKLADPKVDVKFLESMVTQVFGSGDSTKAWTEFFAPEERQKFFKMFTSPDILKNLEKIKGTEAAKHVQLFVERTARANLQTSADTIVDKITEPGGAVTIEIDPESGRLRAVQTRRLTEQERALGGRFGSNPGSAITPAFQKQIDLMNENIDVLTRQYKMMGLNPKTEIQAFLKAVGVNETNPRRANVWQMMLDRLTDREGNTQVDETSGNPVQKQNLNPEIQPQRFGTGTTPPNIQMTNMFGNEEGPVSVQQIDAYVEKRAKEIGKSLGITSEDFKTNEAIFTLDVVRDDQAEKYVSLKQDTGTDYQNITPTSREDIMFSLITKAESGKNAYNKIYGGKTLNLTSMTVGDILALQREMVRNGSPSSAVGRFQFINDTLKGLISDLGIPLNATFNEELQNKLGTVLLKRRGWDKFLSGKISEDQFINNLAREWAGLPRTDGITHYRKGKLNKANVSVDAVRKALKTAKEFKAAQAE